MSANSSGKDRILHVMHLLPNLNVGGMENGVINLLNNHNRENIKVSLCCINDDGPLKSRIYQKDVEIINLKQKPGKRYFLIFTLYRLFKKLNVDIVHTHNFYTGFYGIPAARLARVPVVVHGEHGKLPQTKAIKFVMKYIFGRSEAILTVSNVLRNGLLEVIPSLKDKVHAIINGVDTKIFCKFDNKIDKKEEEHVVGTVGRLCPEKDYATLLQAFELVLKEVPDSRLVIVGKGELEKELKEFTKKLNITEKVDFLGERNDIPQMLNTFDIFALSSTREGCSNVILEAFATGLPVVATNVGDNPILLSDDRGVLVETGNPKILASSIIKLIRDYETRKRISDNAFHWVTSTRTLKNMVAEYENFYQDLYHRKSRKNHR